MALVVGVDDPRASPRSSAAAFGLVSVMSFGVGMSIGAARASNLPSLSWTPVRCVSPVRKIVWPETRSEMWARISSRSAEKLFAQLPSRPLPSIRSVQGEQITLNGLREAARVLSSQRRWRRPSRVFDASSGSSGSLLNWRWLSTQNSARPAGKRK